MELETIIGLEIHAELDTVSKTFCSCKVSFGEKENTHVCPVCMGMPGTLPVLNKKVAEHAVRLGTALNCKVNRKSQMARKNYFYPDLPKGYQISQGSYPICSDGYLYIDGRKICIERIHIEEDAAKLIHAERETRIDYNRAGIGLVEIVTKPDLRSAQEAKRFLDEVRDILVCLGVSQCRMQEGHLRCDVNVSVRKKGHKGYNERCEMKNINSFSAVERCILFEEARQKRIIAESGTIERETRRWIDEKNISTVMRGKETSADYRYFPEPDLGIIYLTDEDVEEITKNMPELPGDRRKRYKQDYGLSDYECDNIVKAKRFTEIFEQAVSGGALPKKVCNYILGVISAVINERDLSHEDIKIDGYGICKLIELTDQGVISSCAANEVLKIAALEGKSPESIVKEKGFTQENDVETLKLIVKAVINENPRSVSDYRRGKGNALGYLVGQCMKKSGGRANPKLTTELLKEAISIW